MKHWGEGGYFPAISHFPSSLSTAEDSLKDPSRQGGCSHQGLWLAESTPCDQGSHFSWWGLRWAGGLYVLWSAAVCGLRLQVCMLIVAVLICIYCRNKQSGCSGGGRSEVLALSPHPKRRWKESPVQVKPAGLGGEVSRAVGKALRTFWVYLFV